MQVFKKWAAAVMQRYPELDVSTCHNYQIAFAFRWQCSNPGCGCERQGQTRVTAAAVTWTPNVTAGTIVLIITLPRGSHFHIDPQSH